MTVQTEESGLSAFTSAAVSFSS